MWDIDQTLLRTGPLVAAAYGAAFTTVTGRPYQHIPTSLAGRTDRHIFLEAFALNGVEDPERYLEPFFTEFATEFHARREWIVERGYLLPGVGAVVTGLAERAHVVQTLVTGNIRPNAETKIGAFGLERHIDVTVGGYGTDDVVRPPLVTRSLERSRAKYGDFAEVFVVGDTIHDIEAALVNNVTAVGVATGPADVATLKAAGAQHVFETLEDVDEVLRLLAG